MFKKEATPVKNQMVFQRYEIKYQMSRRQQQVILAAMAPYVVPDEYSHSSIRNLYLDTPDFRLIRRSLERPVYKEKLRVRSYGRAGLEAPVFVELKKKYCSVVYKRRLTMPQREALDCIAGSASWPETQIGGELAYTAGFYAALRPAVFLSYERDSYRGVEDEAFRVTFDTEIRYRQEALTLNSDPWGIPILPADQVLMEVKTAGSLPLWMARTLSELGIFKTSFSKYGTAYQTILLSQQRGEQKYA
nr:polyphosphate polymerase domain-containing protein [Clostridium sp. J1101437_171009_A5]